MRSFNVKFVSDSSNTQHFTDQDCDTLEKFSERVFDSKNELWKKQYKGIKIVYAGKILETNQEYLDLKNDSTLFAAGTTKPDPKNDPEPESDPVQVENDLQPQQSPPFGHIALTELNKSYTMRESYATTLMFLSLVRNEPKLRHAYENNFQDFLNQYQRGEFLNIYNNIIKQSEKILEGMENGTPINISIGENHCETEPTQLTQNDRDQLDQLISMGIDPNDAVSAYIRNGKDLKKTMDQLLS